LSETPVLVTAGYISPMVVEDAADVLFRLLVWRNSPMPLDGLNPGVIGGQREFKISLVTVQKEPEVADPTVDVLHRVVNVPHPMKPRGVRHELHEPLSAFPGTGIGLEIRLYLDDRAHQMGVHLILLGRGANDLFQAPRDNRARGRTITVGNNEAVLGACGYVGEMKGPAGILADIHPGLGLTGEKRQENEPA
jgi:hypothetical protein